MLQSQYWIGREWHYWHITRSACTRSVVTAAFVDKGKVKPFDIVLKSNMFSTFSKLGDQIDIQQSTLFWVLYMANHTWTTWMKSGMLPFNSTMPQRNRMTHLKESTSAMSPCQRVWINKALHCNYCCICMEACNPPKSKFFTTSRTRLDSNEHLVLIK